jgi:hypothetical protein
MEVNPDGYLYILSSYEGEGTIFRIVPAFSEEGYYQTKMTIEFIEYFPDFIQNCIKIHQNILG